MGCWVRPGMSVAAVSVSEIRCPFVAPSRDRCDPHEFPGVPESFAALLQMMGLGLTYNSARILIDVEIQRSFPISQLGRARSQVHTVCMAVSLSVYGVVALIGNALAPSVIFGWFGLVALFTGTVFWACFRRDLLAVR